MKIKTILILAGGDGTRFFPLEQKVQFKFTGQTILRYIVSSVSDLAEKIIVVINNRNESAIKSDLSSYPVKYVMQTNDKGGMADAVLAAKQFLAGSVLILNGSDVFDFSLLESHIEKTQKEKNLVGVVARSMKEYFSGGYVQFEGEHASGIIEKPKPENKPSDYVKLVADYFDDFSVFAQELEQLPPSDDQYEQALSALMKKKSAACYKYDGDWATLKYSWHVLSMQDYFFDHLLKKTTDSSVTVHKTSVIEGAVFLGKNVKIGAYCKISGPCYIGDNTVIGDHTLIRCSSIGQNCLVGGGCEVARSYLADGVTLHRNYVGDSILSEGVTMGAGAVTANYRFDGCDIKTPVEQKMIDTQRNKLGLIVGRKAKMGVNAVTYPGVKLSPGTHVLPGEVAKKDR